MSDLQQHKMQLEMTHPSGAQEWCCPVCGRRLLIHWRPSLDVIELNTGNRNVSHFGSTSDELSLGPPTIREVDEPVLSDELRAALEEALEDIDLDDWLGTPD